MDVAVHRGGRRRFVLWVALVLVAAAWAGRYVSAAWSTPAASVDRLAETLYLAELNPGPHEADAEVVSFASIAAAVHGRAVYTFSWIGAGLLSCLAAALLPRWRAAAVGTSAVLFLAGWYLLDAYATVGLAQGLDLKWRLVHNDPARLRRFILLDGLSPALVAAAAAVSLAAACRDLGRGARALLRGGDAGIISRPSDSARLAIRVITSGERGMSRPAHASGRRRPPGHDGK